jgi:D-psicose/D-tagatose/L-ribulose 3-epimerase
MKLAVSNIGWNVAEEPTILELLQSSGVHGVEIAPTKIWPRWTGASVEEAGELRRRYEDHGLQIPALQSVLFECPELRLFSDADGRLALREHLLRVSQIARYLGAGRVVFGSPRNRDRGTLDPASAMDQAAEFFSALGSDLRDLGVCLCIEANPAVYHCNFVTRWFEAAELVRRIASPGIGLHLDVACTVLAGDDPVMAIQQCATAIRHFHISEPHLGGFSAPIIDHARVGDALRKSGYDGWVSIEMRRQDDPIGAVREAILYANRHYA